VVEEVDEEAKKAAKVLRKKEKKEKRAAKVEAEKAHIAGESSLSTPAIHRRWDLKRIPHLLFPL